MNQRKLALGLGIFSIGIGLAELIAPRQIAKSLGMKKHSKFLKVCGMRELATGVGLLSVKRKAPWMWARVAGDVVDLATIGRSRDVKGKYRRNLAIAAAAVAGVTALDIFCGSRLSRQGGCFVRIGPQ